MWDYLLTFTPFVSTRNFSSCLDKQAKQYATILMQRADEATILFFIKSSILSKQFKAFIEDRVGLKCIVKDFIHFLDGIFIKYLNR